MEATSTDGLAVQLCSLVGSQRHHNVQKQICIALTGPEYWCENLARQLNREDAKSVIIRKSPANAVKYLAWIMYFFKETAGYDILHIMLPTSAIKTLKAARLKHIRVVCHWIGSDVLKLRDEKRRKEFFKAYPVSKLTHLAVSKPLSDELAQYGMNAEVFPNITDKVIAEPEPLPTTPGVLSYWTDKRADFFNASIVLDLAKCFPNVPFRVVGATGKGLSKPPNVRFLGHLENMSEVFRQTTVYIRLVPHDGTSIMVAESLARGRYVLYSLPFPYCEKATELNECKEKLATLLRKKELNLAGAEFVRTRFDPEKNIMKLIKMYKEII